MKEADFKKLSSKQELGGANGEERNWKGMIIALLVIILVCGFVVLAVILSAEDEPSFNFVQMDDITVKSWRKSLTKDVQWRSGDLIWMDQYKNIQIVRKNQRQKNISEIVLQNKTIIDKSIEDFQISNDLKYMILTYDKFQRYSHSFHASYSVYDIAKRNSVKLDFKDVQLIKFGPIANELVLVSDGDLYLIPSVSEVDKFIRITSSADKNILNGIANWLYEEEILKSNVATFWSTKGRFLAYAQFNDANVQNSYITSYTEMVNGVMNVLKFPQQSLYPCPKAGMQNPTVKVYVYDTKSGNTSDPITSSIEGLTMLQSVSWSKNDPTLLIKWSNRAQNIASLQGCTIFSTDNLDCKNNLTIVKKEYGNYISKITEKPISIRGKEILVTLYPQHNGGKGYYNHIAFIYNMNEKSKFYFLTDGAWEVQKIIFFDETSNQLYFTSNEVGSRTRHIFRILVDIDTAGVKPDRHCLTCKSNNELSNCSYFDAEFDGSRVLVRCEGPVMPRSFTVLLDEKTHNFDFDTFKPLGYHEKHILDRLEVGKSMYNYKYATVEGGAYDINYQIVFPLTSMEKVGVVFYIGDVGEQSVDDRYKLEFAEFISSHSNNIVVRFDGAGSRARPPSPLKKP